MTREDHDLVERIKELAGQTDTTPPTKEELEALYEALLSAEEIKLLHGARGV